MTIDFLAYVRSESARFGDVLADTDPSVTVPTCPEWTAADLVYHLAEVQGFWGTIVRDRLADPGGLADPERPAAYPDLVALYRDRSAILLDSLAHTADDVAVWTWVPANQTAGFVRRRQAHEALIHRIDAELTAGIAVSDIDPALAADGVSEVLGVMFNPPPWAERHVGGPVGTVTATDTGDTWFVQVGQFSGVSPNTGKTYTDQPTVDLIASGDPSFTISGTAGDLDAWLWNRPTRAPMAIEGDAARFDEVIRSGVQ
jgi:uncharacterized protein (TIGR03083 family)